MALTIVINSSVIVAVLTAIVMILEFMLTAYRMKNRRKAKAIRKVKVEFYRALTYLNGISVIFWVMAIDGVISWEPFVIMAVNMLWLVCEAKAYELKGCK